MALLQVEDLTKDFGGLRAVSALSFDLETGEILGLIGPNGAGKTTAFNLMAGFIAPTSGVVSLDGENIVGLKPHAVVRRGIARTFQVVKPFRKLSCLENVTLAAFLHEANRAKAEAEALRILAIVDMADRRDRHAAGARVLHAAGDRRRHRRRHGRSRPPAARPACARSRRGVARRRRARRPGVGKRVPRANTRPWPGQPASSGASS
jgi:branched-chain amino acid transport system ATP-binding protein